MTSDVQDPTTTREVRSARRIAELDASDPQFAAAQPDPAFLSAARRPGLRLAQVFQTLVEGYGDRPVSYRDLRARVKEIDAAWRNDPALPVSPGDVVATIGFGPAPTAGAASPAHALV
jgi:fatty acid CoA ligase FadD9